MLWRGVGGGTRGTFSVLVLMVRNTNNLLDLQEGNKGKALVSVLKVPPREGGAPSPHASPLVASTCCDMPGAGSGMGAGDRDFHSHRASDNLALWTGVASP